MRRHVLFVALMLCGIGVGAGVKAGSFSTDFNAGLPAGSVLSGSAAVDGGVLKLTPAASDSLGSWMLADLDGGLAITSFTASFKVLVGGGSGADGFSFAFGNDLVAPFGEDGSGTGLVVSFDTFENGGEDAPTIDVRYGGAQVVGGHFPTAIRTGDQFVDVLIKLDADGTLDVTYDGAPIFADLATGFLPQHGQFAFGARTGYFTDNHFVDDVSITTTVIPEPTTVGLVGLSLAGVLALRRKR